MKTPHPLEMGIIFQQTIVFLAQQKSGSSLPVPTEPGRVQRMSKRDGPPIKHILLELCVCF